jgi:menaquinone-dependent protoporphyrinogen oxidase
MSRVLIVYSTTDGHTLKICERLRQVMKPTGAEVRIVPIAEAGTVDLGAYDKIVVGASIRYGRHAEAVHEFVEAHAEELAARPSAFFSVSIVARKRNKNRPETNPYARKFFQGIRWRPRLAAVFAGKLDYPRYRPLVRLAIRLIMLITRGPTDRRAIVEFTDWREVDTFGQRIAEM